MGFQVDVEGTIARVAGVTILGGNVRASQYYLGTKADADGLYWMGYIFGGVGVLSAGGASTENYFGGFAIGARKQGEGDTIEGQSFLEVRIDFKGEVVIGVLVIEIL